MTGRIERSIEELYRDDPERADTLAFGRLTGASRRGFLGGAGLAAMGAAVGGAIPFAANMPGGLIPAALAQGVPPGAAPAAAPPAKKGPIYLNYPGKNDKLVVIGEKPLVAETPEHLLDDDTTPIEKFFIRNNGQIPEAAKEPDKWKITIDGEVNNKLELTLGEFKSKFKPVTRRMVLECGGNGRSFFSPPARGNQWTNGGAGCAEWTGVRLADVLKMAGAKAVGIYTAHYAADLHLSGDASKPTLVARRAHAKAMDPDSMIVWAMNGQPLPNIHGGPVRLIVPGWAGSASQKWLTRITIRDKEHDGPGMGGTSYRLTIKPMVPGDKADPKNFNILESMPVRSIITNPANGAKLAGRHARTETARRLLGRRFHRAARRHFHRLRNDLAIDQARKAEEQIRLAALDRYGEAAARRLLRDLGARAWIRAASCSRMWRRTGIRAAMAATRCIGSRCWSADALSFRNFAAARFARRLGLFAILSISFAPLAGPAAAQSQAFTPRDESPEEFPAGPGRDDTFYACTACHGFKLVAQQGMNRRQWDDTINLMTEKHNMPKLDDKERETVLNYLEATYPPRTPAGGGWQNPFLITDG